VLIGSQVDGRHLLGGRLRRAVERDGTGRRELAPSDLVPFEVFSLVEEAPGFGAPRLLAFRTVVGKQVVVPGDPVHGGGERIGVQPPLVKAVGEVTCFVH
jgi:hypothetical protein